MKQNAREKFGITPKKDYQKPRMKTVKLERIPVLLEDSCPECEQFPVGG